MVIGPTSLLMLLIDNLHFEETIIHQIGQSCNV